MSSNWMLLSSGIKFIPSAPTIDMINIYDIARGLSGENRFANQNEYPISVAQHSVNAYDVAPEEYKLEALLHDGSEGLIKDLPTAIKRMLPDYQKLEDTIQGLINRKYGLPVDMSAIVKEIDMRLLITEAASSFRRPDSETPWWELTDYEPYSHNQVDVSPWTPYRAEEEFLDRCTEQGLI